MIEVSHLTINYGGHLAVDDVSFTVEDGQIYGLNIDNILSILRRIALQHMVL